MMRILTYMLVIFSALQLSAQKLDQAVSESQLIIGQPVVLKYSVVTEKDDTLFFKEKADAIKARSITKTGDLSIEGIEFEITRPFVDTFIFHSKFSLVGKSYDLRE